MGTQTVERTTDERLQSAVSHKIDGRYDEAETLLQEILEAEPGHARARREYALVLGFTGRFEESLDELKAVCAADPSFLDARNDLGMTYAMLGMVDEAKTEFEAILEMDPTNEKALRQIVYFQ
jgi:tetratricopeptide (TPR) repeat protein